METSRKGIRLTASVCLLALAACSSGGGGGGSASPTTPTVPNTPTTPTTPRFRFGAAPVPASVTMNIANPPSYNFMGNPAPNGTTFNLIQSSMDTTSTTATGHSLSSASLTLANLGVLPAGYSGFECPSGGSGPTTMPVLFQTAAHIHMRPGAHLLVRIRWPWSLGIIEFRIWRDGLSNTDCAACHGVCKVSGSGATGGAGAVILTPSGTAPSPSVKCRVMPASM